MAAKKSRKSVKEPSAKATQRKSVIARSNDGTIQITFSIPFKEVKAKRQEAALELGKNMEIPGFRKGKAPLDRLISQIPQATLIEKTLGKILPKLIANAISKHKIKPAIYPKFELVKAQEGENWQIRATTCELPRINLGDYKKTIAGSLRAKAIWAPRQARGKLASSGHQPDKKGEPTHEEKEQEVIKTLLETVKIDIPKLLIDEEVNQRLSNLLSRLEKLGLTLENYLASIGKTAESLRQEYEKQARDAINLELILNKIAEEESIKIEEEQIENTIKASSASSELTERLKTPEQRRLIESVLKRRGALDSLVSLL